ncbi:hypothetical protein GCM10022202_26420 [Microbacterium marinilacus]|uniref:Uncharacterized protein n=1 Tax=Microbacterium marinilacus TaxID=415209 RepID=A0ABP7BL06_9MICO
MAEQRAKRLAPFVLAAGALATSLVLLSLRTSATLNDAVAVPLLLITVLVFTTATVWAGLQLARRSGR